MTNRSSSSLYWVTAALLVIGIAWRFIKLRLGADDPLPNFAPWMALAFAGSALLPQRWPFWSIPVLMLLVDAATPSSLFWQNPVYLAVVYACFLAAALAGRTARARGAGVLGTLGGTLACTLGFYLITNSLSWITDPHYAKTAAGWWQALTTGLPGFPPTWAFLRNALLGDGCFAALLLAARNAEAGIRREPKLAWLNAA